MKGVSVAKLDLVKNDQRGSIFEFTNRQTNKILFIKRKKGTISGGHYHTGKNKLKKPETLIMLSGKFTMILKNVKTGESATKTYSSPYIFKINPYIYHKIKALTDIYFLDLNSIKDDDDILYDYL